MKRFIVLETFILGLQYFWKAFIMSLQVKNKNDFNRKYSDVSEAGSIDYKKKIKYGGPLTGI